MRWEKNVSPLCPVVVITKPVSPPNTVPCNVGIIMSQPPIMDYGSSSSAAAASPLFPAVPSGDGMPQQQQQQQPTPRATTTAAAAHPSCKSEHA